jgi:hypothetical protein
MEEFRHIFIVWTSLRTKTNQSYIIFNFFAIFFLFYVTRIARLEKKKSTKLTPFKSAKELALKAGRGVESILIRKDDGGKEKADTALNSANFAIFQGAGLETLDSRGLGREWTRRDHTTD